MRIPIANRTLTKEEQFELGKLLLKAGYEVSIRKGETKDTKSVTYINLKGQDSEVEEEDLS